MTRARGVGAAVLLLALTSCTSDPPAAEPAAPASSPVGPSPSPSPSTSVPSESPGPGDHPISLYDADGALVLLTVRRLGGVGTATLWRKEPGGWRRLGVLKHAVPPERVDPSRTHLVAGPASGDVVALDLAHGRIASSRDGGATWRYLAEPAACTHRTCSPVYSTATDYQYVHVGRTVVRAAFGTSAWEEIAVPRGAPDRSVGLLALEGALLAVDSDCDTTPNHYRVSRDHGDTWSRRRDLPAHTCIYGSAGRVAYAADAHETQWWRSSDLVHWEQAPTSPYDVLARRAWATCPASTAVGNRADGPPVRIGDDVYRLIRLRSHDARALELRVSHDGCRTWQRVATARPTSVGWPGPLRPGSVLPAVSRRRARGWVDPRDAAFGGIDLLQVSGNGRTYSGVAVFGGRNHPAFGAGDWRLQLAAHPPPPATLDPGRRVIEYGVVVDGDGDRAPDCQIAIDDGAGPLRYRGERLRKAYRVWVTNLRTGTTAEQVGPPYGVPVEFTHPGESRHGREVYFSFLGDEPASCDEFTPSGAFYAYSSLTEDGEVTGWDYAPNAAWLPMGCSRACHEKGGRR